MRNYPSTKGEIADHLEFMAALLPDGIAGGEITVTVQSAFEELEQGLKNCRSRLGEIDFQKCSTLSADAKAAYEEGADERGFDILYTILGVITGKKFIRLSDFGNA